MSPQQTIETEGWSFIDWIQANTRAVGIGAVVVAIAAGGYWYYVRSGQIKRQNAERSLNQAKQALTAGNPALAATDLQRAAERYTGTVSGAQAALLLAQLRFDEGKYDEGLQVLERYQSESASGALIGPVWERTGDGQVAQGNLEEGAASYERAAQETQLMTERALLSAKAARTFGMAGKNAEAQAIWERLLDDPTAALVHSEARLRLGELTAKTAS